jgi:hypothetical protein
MIQFCRFADLAPEFEDTTRGKENRGCDTLRKDPFWKRNVLKSQEAAKTSFEEIVSPVDLERRPMNILALLCSQLSLSPS